MPELDGVDACHLIRARNKNIPIILSSGYNQKEELELPASGKDTYFLKKPYRLDRLRTLLREALHDNENASPTGEQDA